MRKLFTTLATLVYVSVAASAAWGDPIEATPASGSAVSEISEITLKLTDKETYPQMRCDTYTHEYVTVTKEGSTQNLSKVSVVSLVTYEQYRIKLETPITEAGTYTVTIPQKSYYLFDSDWSNRSYDIVLTYTVGGDSGVDAVGAEAADSAVYNLNGVRVGDSLENLPAGVYVTNGRKVIVGEK